MGRLAYRARREDPQAWAKELAVSREAMELYLSSDVIDLHIDSFIWHRIFGLPMAGPNSRGPLNARFLGQVDFARVREANITGATWVITTNPFRPAEERARAFVQNLARLRAEVQASSGELALVRTAAEYRAARAEGKHGAFVGVQGGNAFDRDLDAVRDLLDDTVLRVTLVHLTSSRIGASSAPLGRLFGDGLTTFGKELVRCLEQKRIFADLAHISKKGFWDAVAVHDRSLPLIVTHTGVEGAYAHWRNIDDAQLKAIADSGGTVGIMYHGPYLEPARARRDVDAVVRHVEHALEVVGDDFVSLGSDWDGAILPVRGMPTCLELPILVERMLVRGIRPESIRKILGQNFLRVVEAMRG